MQHTQTEHIHARRMPWYHPLEETERLESGTSRPSRALHLRFVVDSIHRVDQVPLARRTALDSIALGDRNHRNQADHLWGT